MAYLDQAAQIYDSGWITGSNLTASWSGSYDVYHSVYVMASGALPPQAGNVSDRGVNLGGLVMPAAGGTAVTFFGPAITGTDIANTMGYRNVFVPEKPAVQIQATGSVSSSWYRVMIVGR